MFRHVPVALPVLLLAGCSGSASASSTPSTSGALIPTVSSITVSRRSPALGETTQFTATATLSNATKQDVTAQAMRSSDDDETTMSGTSMVRSVAAGEADITATCSGVTGSPHVRVTAALPVMRPVTGENTDDSIGRSIVEWAEAQVMDGENGGRARRADGNGVYSTPNPVAGTCKARARATGHTSRDHRVTLEASGVRVDFALRAVPRVYVVTAQFDPAWRDSHCRVPSGRSRFMADGRRTAGDCSWEAEVVQIDRQKCVDRDEIELMPSASGSGSATLTCWVPPNVYPPCSAWPRPDMLTPPLRREIDVLWNCMARIQFEQRLCAFIPPAFLSAESSTHPVAWNRYCEFAVSPDATWLRVAKRISVSF
jgi:hypothetical protein